MAFSKILIANRGEIACRVIRTARAMGYRTVAVFSDADEAALHVRMADEAVRIGPGPAAQSYLRIDGVLEAVRRTGADAVHPGYGFLSENAAFAEACQAAGLVFIGPAPETIRVMGDKALAKARMVEAGVPVVPGAAVASEAAAEKIGFPVMVKAVAGGGGRGMRVVRAASELEEAMESAGREAASAFGDGTLMLEKLVEHGRHIEFQVFGDSHGHVVHLGERDCTAQRRRQKVIEESPSPVVGTMLRARMAAAAVAAAQAVNYVGAGTIEFILGQDEKFYFLEMNTRLQVEHPVTECVTGLDLVEWQLRVANGENLPRGQDEIHFTGHAIEARLCAENPYEGFAPQTGDIRYFAPCEAGIRVDAGVETGSRISPYYDSMVAKFVAHGATRGEAIRKLCAALARAPLLGLETNAGFLGDVLQTPEFAEGRMHTAMIDEWADGEILQAKPPAFATLALAAAIFARAGSGFWNRGGADYGLTLQCGSGEAQSLSVRQEGGGSVVRHGDKVIQIKILEVSGDKIWFERDGVRGWAMAVQDSGALHLAVDGIVQRFGERQAFAGSGAAADATKILAPVAGTLVSILPAGTPVKTGDVVAVIEAMKIETRIAAAMEGVVNENFVAAGAQVKAKKVLAVLEARG
jgi:geranyl-CoA carboxylase alpha subunit